MSCEARTRGSGEVLCAKKTFFLVKAVIINDPSQPTALLAGFSTMMGNPLLFFVFWYDNCEQLKNYRNSFFSTAGEARSPSC